MPPASRSAPTPPRCRGTVAFVLVARTMRRRPPGASTCSGCCTAGGRALGRGQTVQLARHRWDRGGGGPVEHATRRQLQLLSSQSLPVVYSHDPKGCAGGGYAAHVTVGPNTTPVTRTVAFALVASGPGSASTSRFYVVVGPAGQGGTGTAPTTTTTPTTTTVPLSAVPATTTVPSSTAPKTSVATAESSNWSGYVTTGGP